VTDEFNRRLDGLAEQLTSPSSPVVVAAADRGFQPGLHTVDGTHPNGEGDAVIADAFADALARSFSLGAARSDR
jgi:lysophospholipase L1-like esterase